MKIINFQASNFKGIRAIEIAPDGNMIVLSGKNKQGKTSVLDGIWAALLGGDASRAIAQPIREGETQASIRLDLGEYIVTRRWKDNGVGTLTVESPRGAQYGTPQKLLDSLVSKFSMDIMGFSKQTAKEQVATLTRVLGESLGFDPDEIEERRSAAFEARKLAKRDLDKFTAQLNGMPTYPEDTPDTETSASELLEQIQLANEANATRAEVIADSASFAVEVEDAKAALAAAQQDLADREKEYADSLIAVAALPDEVDVASINSKFSEIEADNANVRGLAARKAVEAELAEANAEWKRNDDALTDIAKEKTDALANAKLPLEGLSFDENGVTLNGIAFMDLSGREKREVCFALATSENPEIRVVRIDEGESLDSEGLAHIAQMADERDYQVWVSRVDESGDVGIIIEDGMVKAA